jgi:ribose 5-phosphate isomerase A
MEMTSADAAKKRAAEAAIAQVESGMRLGLGTGSTMRFALEALGARLAMGELRDIVGIPTSQQTADHACKLGIALGDFADIDMLDLAIDGADEVETGTLNLIKGLGGALLREKIVAANSRRFVVVADASKQVVQLGAHAPVPVEVTAFGHQAVARRLTQAGARPVLRCDDSGQPAVTDGGNLIYDCHDLGPITDAAGLDQRFSAIAGVAGTGLFHGLATEALIADGDHIRILRRA